MVPSRQHMSSFQKKPESFSKRKKRKNKTPSNSKNNQIMEQQQRKGNCNVSCDLLKFGQCLEIAVNRESNLCMRHKI